MDNLLTAWGKGLEALTAGADLMKEVAPKDHRASKAGSVLQPNPRFFAAFEASG